MTVADVKNRVQQMLTEFANSVSIDSDGDFGLTRGSAKVFVRVSAWHERTVVTVFSQFLFDVPVTPDLFRWVATDGQDEFVFGHTTLFLRDDGTARLGYETRLLGDYLDTEELRTAVTCVALAADDLDDRLKTQFGGRRFGE